jgi:hypothetical protein
MMCGVAGALYVPQVGIINPSEMSPANSIEIAIWAAVGGRATLIGPIVGAFIVNGAKSWLTVTARSSGCTFLGALFIAVTLFLPNGVVGLVKKLKGGRKHDARTDGTRRQRVEARKARWPRCRRARPNPVAARPASRAWPSREGGHHPRPHPVPGRCERQLRRLQGHQQALAGHCTRRAALHHRPQWRGQDHDDGHHHRQDPARLGHRVFWQHHRPAALQGAEIAQLGIGRKFQKPTVFEQLTVFENLELALKTNKGVQVVHVLPAGLGAGRPPGRGAAHHPPGRQCGARPAT